MAELDYWAWKGGSGLHQVGQSLEVLMEKGKQVVFSKLFWCLNPSYIIFKDETGTVFYGCQFCPAIGHALIVNTATVTTTTGMLRLFVSFDANIEQSAI